MKVIARRLAWLEDRFVPLETEESRRIRELLRQARERAAKDTGQRYQELPPLPRLPITVLDLGDCLLAGRERARREAAQQKSDLLSLLG